MLDRISSSFADAASAPASPPPASTAGRSGVPVSSAAMSWRSCSSRVEPASSRVVFFTSSIRASTDSDASSARPIAAAYLASILSRTSSRDGTLPGAASADMDSSDAATVSCIFACSSWLSSLVRSASFSSSSILLFSTALRACWAAASAWSCRILRSWTACSAATSWVAAAWAARSYLSASSSLPCARARCASSSAWRAFAFDCSTSVMWRDRRISSWRWLPITAAACLTRVWCCCFASSIACWIWILGSAYSSILAPNSAMRYLQPLTNGLAIFGPLWGIRPVAGPPSSQAAPPATAHRTAARPDRPYLRRLPAGADQMSPGDARSGRPGPGPGAHRVEGRALRPVPAHRDGDLAVADHRLRVGDGGLRLGLGRRRPQRLGNDLPHRGRTLGQLPVGEHLLGQLGPGEMVGRLPQHLRQAGTQRVADRRQQLAGRLLLAPLDLREVPERDVRGAGDLPQRPPLTLTPCAQGVTDHPTKQHRRLLPLSTACSQRYPLARTSASRPARVSQVTTGFQPHSGHAGTPDVRGRPAPEGPSSRSASSCSAAATVPARTAARSPDSRSDRTDGSP